MRKRVSNEKVKFEICKTNLKVNADKRPAESLTFKRQERKKIATVKLYQRRFCLICEQRFKHSKNCSQIMAINWRFNYFKFTAFERKKTKEV
jgi:hypothetical protein